MSTLVRQASAADLSRLGQLAGALVRFHHDLDPHRFMLVPGVEAGYARYFASELANPAAILLVAEHDQQIVGYAYGRLESRDWNALLDAHGAVHDILVDPSAQRRGVGKQLLTALLTELDARGAPRVLLHTAVSNERAQALFRACGFQPTMIEMTRERAKTR